VFVILFAAGVRLRYLAIAGGAGLAAAMLLIVGEAYRRTRFFDAWLNPWADREGNGYQLIQGLIAMGSGGWFGTGLGTSRAKWDFLPNAHSDFIFAVIGEELGLVGALVVLAAFGVLICAGVRIALHARGTFERLLAAGIVGWIGVQAIVNMGAVTGLLPITGIPLPLVSFGGTALVVTLAGIGMLASVARDSARAGRRSAARR
jgi:cell division protein FtsW